MNAPARMGRVPPGWKAPTIDIPNPIDVGDEFEKNAITFETDDEAGAAAPDAEPKPRTKSAKAPAAKPAAKAPAKKAPAKKPAAEPAQKTYGGYGGQGGPGGRGRPAHPID